MGSVDLDTVESGCFQADGRVADELAALRSERDRLDEALAVEDPV